MLKLKKRGLEFFNFPQELGRKVLRVSTNPDLPSAFRSREILLTHEPSAPSGYFGFLSGAGSTIDRRTAPSITLLPELGYVRHGDIIVADPKDRSIRVLYRQNSRFNSFLLTERCNHYCVMCSQPPKDVDDSHLANEVLEALELVDPSTGTLGFTGGEPTLLDENFFKLVLAVRSFLPNTALAILTNGRRFVSQAFAERYAEMASPMITACIPLYSDVSTIHDFVVQSDGAFDETIRGILNLKRLDQRVEVRVVVHAQTYQRLPQLAEFLARNLMMVDHVALMALEVTGFARANLDSLWIDPWDYRAELEEAVSILSGHRMNVSVYNHPLCLVNESVRPFAKQSISDWKNEYFPVCNGCNSRDRCCGFFSSSVLKFSNHITPFLDLPDAPANH